ncbi:MAG TPA: VTT domain-containing protein [Micavibrio sp.]|nr:VTT domain-containing protein [Micavibrio sp.]
MATKAAVMDFDKNKALYSAGIAIVVIFALIFLSAVLYEDQIAWKDSLAAFLEQARGTPWALPLVCAVYLFGTLIFFPVILMNLVCAMVFGLWGIVYALIGGMVNAAVYFGVGHFLRHRKGGAQWRAHPKIAPVDRKLQKAGLTGVVIIQSLPAPPFMVTNFIAGLSSVNLATFMTGTFVALLPGAIVRGIVGDSLTKLILHPTQETYLYLAFGIVLWISLIACMHAALKKYTPQEASGA